MTRSLFILLGIFVIFASAQDELTVCTNRNPSPDNICTLEYAPVCAYRFVCIPGSTDFPCQGFTIGNACEACDQQGFDYYFDGACEGAGTGEEEGPTEEFTEEYTEGTEGETEGVNDGVFYCSSLGFIPTNCTDLYAPVCAYNVTENGTTEGVTINNGCVACLDQYDHYTEGACPSDEELPTEESGEDFRIIWCPVGGLVDPDAVCTLEYNPVCAYNATGSNVVGTTVGNSCEACSQRGFNYYTEGPCEGDGSGTEEEVVPTEEEVVVIPPEEEEGNSEETNFITYCSATEVSPAEEVVCTDQFQPVCAYHNGEDNIGTTVTNACQACLQGYDYYSLGSCENNEGGEEVVVVGPEEVEVEV